MNSVDGFRNPSIRKRGNKAACRVIRITFHLPDSLNKQNFQQACQDSSRSLCIQFGFHREKPEHRRCPGFSAQLLGAKQHECGKVREDRVIDLFIELAKAAQKACSALTLAVGKHTLSKGTRCNNLSKGNRCEIRLAGKHLPSAIGHNGNITCRQLFEPTIGHTQPASPLAHEVEADPPSLRGHLDGKVATQFCQKIEIAANSKVRKNLCQNIWIIHFFVTLETI